ncbi:MAG: nitronate monooxygenase [Parvibaculum sp.]|uniref:nitronate monooxygenase n=1 Tax=Parvibaculum sp. TaxID=2024848 RepID=UPI00284AF644|nr:nitronate monooxygenase [Parvibaculum sp.]MDR3499830.1 nitronate monooxygenase [Parvibaculum sp.]
MSAVFHTAACDILGCDLPVVLAGMGGVARAELVAAVSEAGGYGFLGMVRESPRFIRKQIHEVRAATGRDFGVTLIPAATPPDLFREELQVCIEERVHSVCLFWGVDRETIARLRASGILVVCQIGTAAEASAAIRAGAQMLIAQGVEAGGHVRGETARSVLLKETLAVSGDVPVLAAGGVATGADLLAALDDGASGVVLGTALLATKESFAHDYHKRRIVEASPGDTLRTQDFHINWPRGAFVRVLGNSVTQGAHGDPFRPEREIIGEDFGRSLYRFSTDSPLRTTSGSLEQMALYAGTGAGSIADIPSAASRIDKIVGDALALRTAAQHVAAVPGENAPAELASPSCSAAAADDAYMGFLPRDEVVSLLNLLLEAERAGARAAARLALDLADPASKAEMKALHADETFCCRLLLEEIAALGATPSPRIGDFYDKLMGVEPIEDRVPFLAKGQRWVARKLHEALPKIRDDRLHARLVEMLALHEV